MNEDRREVPGAGRGRQSRRSVLEPRRWALLLSGAALLGSLCAHAATPAVEAYRAQLVRAAEEYRADRARCDAQPEAQRDACIAAADARQAHTRAQARATFKGTPRAHMQARIEAAEADYDLAVARCRGTHDEDICKADARAELARATEQAKLDYAYGGPESGGAAVDAGTPPATGATRSLGTHECAALLDIDERYRCIRRAEEAGRM
jgi:pyruvate/2-oxoglutarate dehydrogenase complex dihydrolipoamide acyltransferase (E2) component